MTARSKLERAVAECDGAQLLVRHARSARARAGLVTRRCQTTVRVERFVSMHMGAHIPTSGAEHPLAHGQTTAKGACYQPASGVSGLELRARSCAASMMEPLLLGRLCACDSAGPSSRGRLAPALLGSE